MDGEIAIIGFGEAGRTFALAADWSSAARAFDIKSLLPEARDAIAADYADAGVTGCASTAEALSGAAFILSLVTADQALAAAGASASHLAPGALYLDMNSVSPGTKRAAADLIGAADGRYVDVAVMAPVIPARMDVPLLLSSPHAQAGMEALTHAGFTNVKIAGDSVGRASTIKMLRSVMYKGMEALTAECLLACERAGVVDEVLQSLGNDWASVADYRLDRMMVHGARRAAEMREASRTLEELGIAPLMTRGTAERQAQIGAALNISPPDGLPAKLKVLST